MKRLIITSLALATALIAVETANAAPLRRNVLQRGNTSAVSQARVSRGAIQRMQINDRNSRIIRQGAQRQSISPINRIGQKVRPIDIRVKKPLPIVKPLPIKKPVIQKPLPFPKPGMKKPLPFPKPGVKKPILTPVIGGKKILPIGGKVFKHGKNFKIQKNYHLHFGKKFKFGFCYVGLHHQHWSECCWMPNYGCYGYYCPSSCCYYYWCEPFGCYYPVTYCPTGWYCY